jgi:hypothetical protein
VPKILTAIDAAARFRWLLRNSAAWAAPLQRGYTNQITTGGGFVLRKLADAGEIDAFAGSDGFYFSRASQHIYGYWADLHDFILSTVRINPRSGE